MKVLLHCIDLLSEWTGKITAFLIVVMSLVIGYEVVARYLLVRPTVWAHETSAMVFGAYIVLGGAYALNTHGHVNVDIVYGCFSPRGRVLADVLTFCIFALFCGALVWKGGESAWNSLKFLERSGSVWNPPVYHMKIITFIGCLLLLLQGLVRFVRDVVTLFRGDAS
jgi:TRAP-type mannitol/chloroaromatic compound transport system permease small subunit